MPISNSDARQYAIERVQNGGELIIRMMDCCFYCLLEIKNQFAVFEWDPEEEVIGRYIGDAYLDGRGDDSDLVDIGFKNFHELFE